MTIKRPDNAKDIGEAFVSRFVMSWEEFQVKNKAWIAKMAKMDDPIDLASKK